jgi:thioredoxin reductase
MDVDVYDVIVIGAGPAGCQAAISAAHQMRSVLVLDAGPVSQKKGRAYWSKAVDLEDVPVFEGITGPHFIRRLHKWMASRPIREIRIAGQTRKTGIHRQGGMVLRLTRREDGVFDLETSVAPISEGTPLNIGHSYGRTVVIASGFEDVWPDIEIDRSAARLFRSHKEIFRYAGNAKGWHVCIRCDGHLHVDQHLAIVGVGDYIYSSTLGAQDFTDKITLLINGRPHGMSPRILDKIQRRGIEIIEEKIVRHIGNGTDLLGLELADGRELFFDGFLVDEGLVPNAEFLSGWEYQKDGEGLIIVDEDHQLLDPGGRKMEGLFAAGDIVSGERKLIATAFASGQDAGLAASDSLREWD